MHDGVGKLLKDKKTVPFSVPFFILDLGYMKKVRFYLKSGENSIFAQFRYGGDKIFKFGTGLQVDPEF